MKGKSFPDQKNGDLKKLKDVLCTKFNQIGDTNPLNLCWTNSKSDAWKYAAEYRME